jgi:outer membrane protein TolC
MKQQRNLQAVGLGLLIVLLAGCAAPTGGETPTPAAATLPLQWQAPLPHQGRVSDLSAWWSQFDDPLLTRLIAAAQQVSPSIASAASRIEQSRATRIAAGAGQGPTLDLNNQLSRGVQELGATAATTASFGLQASWEIDLFGGQRAATGAAQARSSV